MNMRINAAGAALGLFLAGASGAQTAEPNAKAEAQAVRAEVARSLKALQHYTWTERTEVLVGGETKAESVSTCRYTADGDLVRRPAGSSSTEKEANGISKRPRVRKKADKQDYIERAISMIQEYVPPKPQLVDFALDNGRASFRKAPDGNYQIELKHYYQNGDSYVFTYDPSTKTLLRANVSSSLGKAKDTVTLEALFEKLPDGVNHLASATLKAAEKKVQVKTTNSSYQGTS